MGCFYCDEHHEGREAIMFKVGDMKAGTLYLFKDQAHKGRCALALKSHKKELCETVSPAARSSPRTSDSDICPFTFFTVFPSVFPEDSAAR